MKKKSTKRTNNKNNNIYTYIVYAVFIVVLIIFVNEFLKVNSVNKNFNSKEEYKSKEEIESNDFKPASNNQAEKVKFSNLIKTAPVNDITADKEGGVWVATEKGVTHIINNNLANYSFEDGSFPYKQAQTLVMTNNTLKVGTLFGLCQLNESGHFNKDSDTNSLPSQIIWNMSWDGSNLWFGTQKGAAFTTRNGTIQEITPSNTNNSLKDEWCKHIYNVTSWFITVHNSGISMWNTYFPASNPAAWKNIDYSETALNRPINDIAYDGQHLWFATGNGVYKLTTNLSRISFEKAYKFNTYTKIQGLPSDNARSIVYAKDAIWVGTSEGLAKIKNEKIKTLYPASNTYYKNIRKLCIVDDLLWIGTDQGLQYINTATVN